jgi:hypothetical protein
MHRHRLITITQELDEIFESPFPKKASLKRTKVAIVADRGVTDVVEEISA